jgi:hypothetical protein
MLELNVTVRHETNVNSKESYPVSKHGILKTYGWHRCKFSYITDLGTTWDECLVSCND